MKNIFAILVLIVFSKPLIFDYIREIQTFAESCVSRRELAYIAEVMILNQVSEGKNMVRLPAEIESELIFDNYINGWFVENTKIIYYPYLNNLKEIQYDKDLKVDRSLLEKAGEKIKFTPLLKNKRIKVEHDEIEKIFNSYSAFREEK